MCLYLSIFLAGCRSTGPLMARLVFLGPGNPGSDFEARPVLSATETYPRGIFRNYFQNRVQAKEFRCRLNFLWVCPKVYKLCGGGCIGKKRP